MIRFMPFAICTLKFRIDHADSLKEKRAILSALLTRLKKLNLSVIESDFQNTHKLIGLEIGIVRANRELLNKDLQSLQGIIEKEFPNLYNYDFSKEIYS